jgi:hypothetical protein
MGSLIARLDTGDDLGIERIALVRAADGDAELRAALFVKDG